MEDDIKRSVQREVEEKWLAEIDRVEHAIIGDMGGVHQAIHEFKQSFKKLEGFLAGGELKKASDLGYNDLASHFIFLQRCLAGLQQAEFDKQRVIQGICEELHTTGIEDIAYENVAPFVDEYFRFLRPSKPTEHIEVKIGPKSLKCLKKLGKVRDLRIEHIAESILSDALKTKFDELLESEERKPIHRDATLAGKDSYTLEELDRSLEAHDRESMERQSNLW